MSAAAVPELPAPAPRRAERRTRAARRERRIARTLARGDHDAIADLQAEYGRTLLGYLVDTLRDRGAAEDVYQQVLLEAWQRGPSYDPRRASLLGWLLMIARSRASDAQRKRTPIPTDPAQAPEIAFSEDQEALLERWRVAHLLSRIPGEEARILKLRFYDGLSQREIADATGLALGTVKLRMVQGLDRLRTLLDAGGES
jgi:RNA polymerase sigma-70 factor (ECF subfamily)